MKIIHKLLWKIVKYRRLIDEEISQMEKWAGIIHENEVCENWIHNDIVLKKARIYWEQFYIMGHGYVGASLKDYYSLEEKYNKFINDRYVGVGK